MRKTNEFKCGFSLMEMMVVLLITAIVAAAAAPMISKKMVRSAGNTSPWVWVGMGSNSIAYNFDNNIDNKTAYIGTTSANPDTHSKLYIKSENGFPHMGFEFGRGRYFLRFAGDRNNAGVAFTDDFGSNIGLRSVAFGSGVYAGSQAAVAIGNSVNSRAGLGGAESTPGAGQQSVAIGTVVSATDTDAIAIGHSAAASNPDAIAIGHTVTASNPDAIAIGHGASATNQDAVAFGHGSQATGQNAVALGHGAQATRQDTVALGQGSQATGINSIMIGSQVGNRAPQATGTDAIAIGRGAQATGVHDPIAIGRDATSNDDQAVAIGNGSQATQANAIAIGGGAQNTTEALSVMGIAIGNNAKVQANSSRSIAIGAGSEADGDGAVAIGGRALSNRTIAIGAVRGEQAAANASNNCAIAIGNASVADAVNATAVGDSAKAINGEGAIAIGADTEATKEGAIAIGRNSAGHAVASSKNSIAIGAGATASGENSVAIGASVSTSTDNQIVLGSASSTVYIPGKLLVDKEAALGIKEGLTTVRMFQHGNSARQIVANIRFGGMAGSAGELMTAGYQNYGACDIRLKNVGEVFKGGLAELKKLELFHYTFKKDEAKTPHVGVMAQDLMKVFPDAVWKGEDGFYRIRMEDMFYAVINAVKELDERLTALVDQVKSVIDRTDKLEAQVKAQQEVIEVLQKQNAEFEKRLAKLEKKNKKNIEE